MGNKTGNNTGNTLGGGRFYLVNGERLTEQQYHALKAQNKPQPAPKAAVTSKAKQEQ